MKRFRLALWLATLSLPWLAGCCCFDKCNYRKPCCNEGYAGYAASPVIPAAVAPAPCCPPANYGAGYLGAIGSSYPAGLFEAGTPGCTKGCGLVGMPTSIANGGAVGAPIMAGPVGVSPGMGFPPFTGAPTLVGPPPVPAYPAGPYMTEPPGAGGLPAPNTVEPPPVGSLPPLSPVPRLTPTPGGPPSAQPVPADPVSRPKK